MQGLPKIVRERLKAGVSLADHPDANVLAAFSEKSLPRLERDIVLEHLARCDNCRDVVAFALPEVEIAEVRPSPSPSRWLTWPALRWGFATAGAVAIAAVGIVQYQRSTRPQMIAKLSPRNQAAAAHVEPEAPSAVAAPANKMVDRDQTPSSRRALAALPTPPVANERKDETRLVAPSATVHRPPVQNSIVGRAVRGYAGAGGPGFVQQQQTAQAQLQTPSAAAGQQMANMSANLKLPASGAVGGVATGSQPQVQGASAESEQSDYASASVGRAKPPVPAADTDKSKPAQDQPVVSRLKIPAFPGQIGGHVVDPSGAVVANARITITPSGAGEAATTLTDSAGLWVIAGLPSGTYRATAQAQGFKTTDIELNYDASQPAMYSLTLSPGSVSQTVEVSAASVPVEPAAVGGAIAGKEVQQVPLVGRNVTDLASLAPGVVPRWSITPVGGLQRSLDQGSTWQDIDVQAIPADTATVAALAKSSVTKEAIADKKVAKQPAPPVFRAVAANGADVWAGGSGGALFHSLDAGNHWLRILPRADGSKLTGDILSLEFPDPLHGRITTSSSEVWTTSDDGVTWQKQ